jgi:hypothetical protein
MMNPMMIRLSQVALVCGLAVSAPMTFAADPAPAAAAPAANVKYKKGKDINFDELLIQGQLKRPELTVVTGNAAQGTDGLLRLRENFLDQTQKDIGEEVQ